MPIAFWKLFQKCAINLGSLSETMDTGTPCSWTISRMYNLQCHAPDPGPTRLESPNRSPGSDTLYTIYILCCTGTLIDMFFLRAVPVPIGAQTISVIILNHLYIKKNYHRSGVHHNLYIYTESHLPIHLK